MSSEVDICNLALQAIGASRIVSLEDENKSAIECKLAYPTARDFELAAHPWRFSIKRARLAADAVPPAFGRAYAFPLPVDYLRLEHADPENLSNNLDWQIENGKILTNNKGPIDLRYIARIEDTSQFHPQFDLVVALRVAEMICESLTQSTSKTDVIFARYREAIKMAKKTNAIQKMPVSPPEQSFLLARY